MYFEIFQELVVKIRHRIWQASVNDLKIPQKEILFDSREGGGSLFLLGIKNQIDHRIFKA
jgi:hypothetical protein